MCGGALGDEFRRLGNGQRPYAIGRTILSGSARICPSCASARRALGPREATELGLVTFTPDELDWNDEVRLAIESRLALSPDAMTGLEANLRFGEHESMESRIFGRLSAWQNWIFVRPNAVGPAGALKVYGTGNRAKFDWERV